MKPQLEIRQDATYQGDDWWRWRVCLDGPEAALDRVERVVYTLHSTFPNPVRTVTDRAAKFRLETAGWGGFRLRARVHFKDGSSRTLSHDLQLYYPDGTPTLA